MEKGSEKFVAFASRSLSPAEKKYSQLEKKGLPIIFIVKRFHDYLFGRKFTIFFNHQPVQNIFNEPCLVSPLASAHTYPEGGSNIARIWVCHLLQTRKAACQRKHTESIYISRNSFRDSPTSRDFQDDGNITGISSECCKYLSVDRPRSYTVKRQRFTSARLTKCNRWRHASLHFKKHEISVQVRMDVCFEEVVLLFLRLAIPKSLKSYMMVTQELLGWKDCPEAWCSGQESTKTWRRRRKDIRNIN